MVDSTKVLCPLFDEVELLIPGDSPNIFPSMDKMWSFNSLQKRRNMTLLKQSSSNLSGCAKALCPFHSSAKVLSPAIDLIPRLRCFFMTCTVEYLLPCSNSTEVLVTDARSA